VWLDVFKLLAALAVPADFLVPTSQPFAGCGSVATGMRYACLMASRSRQDRKTLQLARQVQRALTFALAETGDERLLTAYVEDVQPAPDASHMLVRVRGEGDPAELMQALIDQTGRLRSEVAAAITRRKAPELSFQIVRD
jgi:ribosome-binding factor A